MRERHISHLSWRLCNPKLSRVHLKLHVPDFKTNEIVLRGLVANGETSRIVGVIKTEYPKGPKFALYECNVNNEES